MSDEPGTNPFAAPEDRPKEQPAGPGGAQPGGAQPGAPAQPYGSAPAQPYGSTPTQPYGSAPAQPYGTTPTQQYGSAPAHPYGTTPTQPYGTPQGQAAASQPYGAAPAQHYGSAPAQPAAPYGASSGQPYGAPPAYGSGSQYPPPPGYSAYPGAYPGSYGGYAPPQSTDPVAVAALVTAIAGLVTLGIASLVGLGLGIWGLVRTRRSGRPGKGLSLAAVIISSVIIGVGALITVVIGIAASNGDFDESSSSSAEAPSSDYDLRTDLTAGSCLDVYPTTFPMSDARVVDCAVPHGAEVIARTTLPGPVELDGEGQPSGTVFENALDQCEQKITVLSPDAEEAGVSDVFFSDPDHWPTQRAAYCVLASPDTDLTGSVVAHTLTGAGLSS
ncbi:hypothetical protein [Cellulomonas alba]|uniref:Septum formation-related domain-containing protein n=1 Tax=Cellulomonas alba TaxID=3053467 RepID=A0ABT7SGH1_9CELL|nr:hypothetical protein [Cellulomonas alba]MDM7855241.1 hypothetical protein [Cellulomonas alba]